MRVKEREKKQNEEVRRMHQAEINVLPKREREQVEEDKELDRAVLLHPVCVAHHHQHKQQQSPTTFPTL